MIDTEEKLVLDKAHKDKDYQELVEQKDNDGYIGEVQRDIIDTFYSVTGAMNTTLQDVPTAITNMNQELRTPEFYALKALYGAKTGRDMETNARISGMERAELLNQALIYLQPVLSLGLRPDFKEGRAIYDQLVVKIQDVRTEIKTSLKVENYIQFTPTGKDKAETSDDGVPDGPDDPGDSDDDADDDQRDGNDANDDPARRSQKTGRLAGGGTQKTTGKKSSPGTDR